MECEGCDYFDEEENVCLAFECNWLECPSLPCEEGYNE